MIIMPLLGWFKDKLVESWKTLVWASIGVGMLAIAMTTTGQELQDRIITIGYELFLSDQNKSTTVYDFVSVMYNTTSKLLFKY